LTLEIILVFAILIVSVIFLIGEWIPIEITALLTLGAIAITGVISPIESLSGFSNPAVVTIWAVFILSGGLTKTGVANIIGKFVLRLGGSGEATMIIVIMVTAGLMSAIMNNVAVAALMLPVVIKISEQTKRSPSRLLMPLAYGCLLGGLTTQIGTPPNILVSDALRDEGLKSFGFFDFTPVGLIVMSTGIVFMVLVGRHLLPNPKYNSIKGNISNWQTHYELTDNLFNIIIPSNSLLNGKKIAKSKLGSVLGWNIISITRKEQTILAPDPKDIIKAGDSLTILGRQEAVNELKNRYKLIFNPKQPKTYNITNSKVKIGSISISKESIFIENTLNNLSFREKFGLNILAIKRSRKIIKNYLQDKTLQNDDTLLIAGTSKNLNKISNEVGVNNFRLVESRELNETYKLYDGLMQIQIPEDSGLVNQSLTESRLGDVLGMRIFEIIRDGSSIILPAPNEILLANDHLVVKGNPSSLEILQSLEELTIDLETKPNMNKLVSENIDLSEAILSPQTVLEGKTMRQINFREKFGLIALSVWRRGQAHSSHLRDIKLRFGDSLLLYGTKKKLQLLNGESDFLVLTETSTEKLRPEKMRISIMLMILVLLPVFLGLMPIYIAAVIGAALMVVTGCLTMEEAYQQIEWKAVFLIAGMLPLGIALDQTGAARLIAEGVVSLVGSHGPKAIMFGMIALTFLATCFVPTAALVVLMAPIVFNTSASMGLAPHSLLMAVAMAASASFMTPVSHPANILVMGPGGYRFIDYLKVGGLMTITIACVLMIALPFFWPL
jgi:di/tricarboxylate transporter